MTLSKNEMNALITEHRHAVEDSLIDALGGVMASTKVEAAKKLAEAGAHPEFVRGYEMAMDANIEFLTMFITETRKVGA